MLQGEQQAADQVSHRRALAPEIPEHQSPEEHLLHKGRQENDDQQRHVGRVLDLGGDGGVVQVGLVGYHQSCQAVHQLVQAVQGHQSDGHELAGPAQVLCKVPGGPTQKAVENDDRGGEEDVVIQDILQSGADGHSQQSADQAEQRGCDKGQHQ